MIDLGMSLVGIVMGFFLGVILFGVVKIVIERKVMILEIMIEKCILVILIVKVIV